MIAGRQGIGAFARYCFFYFYSCLLGVGCFVPGLSGSIAKWVIRRMSDEGFTVWGIIVDSDPWMFDVPRSQDGQKQSEPIRQFI
jgi:hypothetical protein